MKLFNLKTKILICVLILVISFVFTAKTKQPNPSFMYKGYKMYNANTNYNNIDPDKIVSQLNIFKVPKNLKEEVEKFNYNNKVDGYLHEEAKRIYKLQYQIENIKNEDDLKKTGTSISFSKDELFGRKVPKVEKASIKAVNQLKNKYEQKEFLYVFRIITDTYVKETNYHFDENFLKMFADSFKEKEDNKDNYKIFFEDYGTHYFKLINYGYWEQSSDDYVHVSSFSSNKMKYAIKASYRNTGDLKSNMIDKEHGKSHLIEEESKHNKRLKLDSEEQKEVTEDISLDKKEKILNLSKDDVIPLKKKIDDIKLLKFLQ